MKETKSGSENGVTIQSYKKGQVYEISPDLAKAFVDDLDVAERLEEGEASSLTDSGLEKEVDALLTGASTLEGLEKTVEIKPETPEDGQSPTEKTIDPDPETSTPPGLETPEGADPETSGTSKSEIPGEIDDGTDETGQEKETPEDELLMAASGRPYTSFSYATSSMKQRGLDETHEPVEVSGGYALGLKKRKTPYPPLEEKEKE